MYSLQQIIGKKIVAIKGFRTDKRETKYIEPYFILFDDQETVLTLEEQDYYSYHDCSASARLIQITVNKERWANIMSDNDNCPHATTDT